MAHFQGEVHGQRTYRQTIGSKESGMSASLNGWNVGVDVAIKHVDGKDQVTVWKTTGTIGDGPREVVAAWTE